MEEEQCLSRLLHSAAQCSVASSNRRLGYLETRDLWSAKRCCRNWVDWVVLRAWSITLRTEASKVWECSVEDTTCSTTKRVSSTIMLTSVARLPSMWASSSGSQTVKEIFVIGLGKSLKVFHLPSGWPVWSRLSGRVLVVFGTEEKEVLFHLLPWPSMMGEGGPPGQISCGK